VVPSLATKVSRALLGIEHDEPTWFGQEAIGSRAVTSLNDDNVFKPCNSSRHYQDRVRPFNFHNIAHPTRTERSRTGIRCLISSNEKNPAKYRESGLLGANLGLGELGQAYQLRDQRQILSAIRHLLAS
jgi:hypothetical protein